MGVADSKPLRLKRERVEEKLLLSQSVVDLLVDTPVPHLDQLYTYSVPESFEQQIDFGIFVGIEFNGRPTTGVVIAKREQRASDTKLSPIRQIISSQTMLTTWQWQFISSVAEYFMVSRSDILRFAIPRPTKNTKALAVNNLPPDRERKKREKVRLLLTPLGVDPIAHVVPLLQHESRALVLLPDERDIDRFRTLCAAAGITVREYGSHQTKKNNLTTYCAAISGEPGIYCGTRSAVWLPVSGPVFLINDVDASFTERRYPYLHTREVALHRAESSCETLLCVGPAPSLELMHACEESKSIDEMKTHQREIIVRTAPDTFHQTIRSGLSHGAVLVQVAAKGYYNALFCRQCRNRPLCECGGRLRMVGKSAKSAALSCMLCSKNYESFSCAWCKSSQLTTLSKGSDRIAYELGKAFPKVQIAISNSGNAPDAIPDGAIVIATPGCEPIRPNGYAAVVLLDCPMMLNRPILRSEEFARLHWRTALSQVQSYGQVFIDLPLNHREVQSIIRGNYRYSIENELAERSSLKLPPYVSIVRISGAMRTVNQLYTSLTTEFPQLSIHKENQQESEVERIIIRSPQNRLRELKRAFFDMQKIRSAKKLEPLSIEVDPLDL